MDSQKKKIIIIIFSVLILTSLFGATLYYDSYFTAPSRFQVRYEILRSMFIPDQMDDVKILFFSDLDYGTFMDEKRMDKLCSRINELRPDIILFGGDLIDQSSPTLNEATAVMLCEKLYNLQAPLGKFAVLGDFDCRSPEETELIRQVLFESEFELLENRSIILRNNGNESITLTGVDNGMNGVPDITSAFANVSRASYNIVLCHTPDMAEYMPVDLTDYMLSGHSHGGQAYWGIGALYTPGMAEIYFRGKHLIDDLYTLDISNGTGTTIEDVRFLSNAEIVLYRLKHIGVYDPDTLQ